MSTLAATPVQENSSITSRYMTVRDFAKLTGLPNSTAYDYAREGRIPGKVKLGRHIRFDRAAVENWLREGGEAAA